MSVKMSTIVEEVRHRKFVYQDQLFEILSDKKLLAALTVLPATLLFLFVNVLPILWAVTAGFFDISVYSAEWTWSGLSNFVEITQSPDFYSSLFRSLLFTVGSVALQLSTGIVLAVLINRSFRGVSIVRAIILLPYLVPTAVIGLVALWMGNTQYGIINQLLIQAGLIEESIAFFGSKEFALASTIVVGSWKYTVFVVIMVLARLQSIPKGFYEAANVMGATPYERFRDITLPNLKGVLFIVILLRGVWMFNKFDIIWILTQGGPIEATTTAPIYAYEVAFTDGLLGQAAAVSALLFVLLIINALIYFRVFEPSSEVRVE